MTDAPYKVAIVVDPEFGDRLMELSPHLHVWVCDTPTNRSVAESIWEDNPISDLESGVTTFKFAAEASAADIVSAVLGEVDLHHGEYSHDPPWSAIEVIGCAPTPALAATFASFGADIVVTGCNTFQARRQVQTDA